MFDFNGYTLNELTAIDNFVCYTRAMAAEHIDLPQIRKELMQLHRSLSRAINIRLDEAAEEWDVAHKAPADPPAPPDMFGWVGDALDDLCAAAEVIEADE